VWPDPRRSPQSQKLQLADWYPFIEINPLAGVRIKSIGQWQQGRKRALPWDCEGTGGKIRVYGALSQKGKVGKLIIHPFKINLGRIPGPAYLKSQRGLPVLFYLIYKAILWGGVMLCH
jgi:hypothetical protein